MMVFFIRLKTGFFETKFCTMSVRDKAVRLYSENMYEDKQTIIHDGEILSIAIINKGRKATEIEIHSTEKIYVGHCIDTKDKDEIANAFLREFGSKVQME